jgi:hypothetical protein
MARSLVDSFDIDSNIISCDASHRGGGMRVDVSSIFTPTGEKMIMGAYQNYLGGGMRGAVQGGSMFKPVSKEIARGKKIMEKIKRYYHDITNSEEDSMNDEWNTTSYEQNQKMPMSAY